MKAQLAAGRPIIKNNQRVPAVSFSFLPHLTVQKLTFLPACQYVCMYVSPLYPSAAFLSHPRHPLRSRPLKEICLYWYVQWKTAGPLHFFINLHLSQTAATLTSLRLVTSVINTIWAQDLSSLPPLPLCSFCHTALTVEAHTALKLMFCRACIFFTLDFRPG